jgi:hypothetical protein
MVHVSKNIVEVNKWPDEVRRLAEKFRNITVSLPGSLRHKRNRCTQQEALVSAWDRIKKVKAA